MAFEPRQIINGSLIRQFIGKNVSLFVKPEGDLSSKTIRGKTSDNQDVRILLPEPLEQRPSGWVEVLGSPVSADTIKAREVIVFEADDQEFDIEGHNMLVTLLNHCKDFYKQG